MLKKRVGSGRNGVDGSCGAVSSFEVIIFRPGGILPKDSGLARKMLPVLVPVVSVSELAQATVEAALGGSSKKVLQNGDIVLLAKAASAKLERK